jgi:hypothetical protein
LIDFSRRAIALRGRKRKTGAVFGKNRQKGVRKGDFVQALKRFRGAASAEMNAYSETAGVFVFPASCAGKTGQSAEARQRGLSLR